MQAKAANVSVNDVATVLSTTGGGTPPVGGPAALVAANKAFGATAASLAKASGQLLSTQHVCAPAPICC